MSKSNRYTGLQTTAIHAGEAPDPTTNASAPAIHMSSTFVVEEAASLSAHGLSEDSPFLYGRWASPTVEMLAKKIATLEGTEDCLCLASGMAAATAIFMTLLSNGDHAIISDVSYAGVAELVRETLPRFGVEISTVDMTNLQALADAVRPNTRLIHCETPANPIMRLTDLAAVSEIAEDAGAYLSCDSTFATPIGCRPADFGVDIVMHSITKYIGGHGDAIGGALAGSRELIGRIRDEAVIHHGGVMSPFNAWLIARGAATLPLRMKAHEAGAMAVAKYLEAHPAVARVIYPGLKSHPQHELARRQMNNYSGMLSFQVGDAEAARAVADRMMKDFEVIHYAVSVGHHRSLIFLMETEDLIDTSFKLEGAQLKGYRAFAGDAIFRMSVGLEDAEDLIADLGRVLD